MANFGTTEMCRIMPRYLKVRSSLSQGLSPVALSPVIILCWSATVGHCGPVKWAPVTVQPASMRC